MDGLSAHEILLSALHRALRQMEAGGANQAEVSEALRLAEASFDARSTGVGNPVALLRLSAAHLQQVQIVIASPEGRALGVARRAMTAALFECESWESVLPRDPRSVWPAIKP
jgi:hypothetical protein